VNISVREPSYEKEGVNTVANKRLGRNYNVATSRGEGNIVQDLTLTTLLGFVLAVICIWEQILTSIQLGFKNALARKDLKPYKEEPIHSINTGG